MRKGQVGVQFGIDGKGAGIGKIDRRFIIDAARAPVDATDFRTQPELFCAAQKIAVQPEP